MAQDLLDSFIVMGIRRAIMRQPGRASLRCMSFGLAGALVGWASLVAAREPASLLTYVRNPSEQSRRALDQRVVEISRGKGTFAQKMEQLAHELGGAVRFETLEGPPAGDTHRSGEFLKSLPGWRWFRLSVRRPSTGHMVEIVVREKEDGTWAVMRGAMGRNELYPTGDLKRGVSENSLELATLKHERMLFPVANAIIQHLAAAEAAGIYRRRMAEARGQRFSSVRALADADAAVMADLRLMLDDRPPADLVYARLAMAADFFGLRLIGHGPSGGTFGGPPPARWWTKVKQSFAEGTGGLWESVSNSWTLSDRSGRLIAAVQGTSFAHEFDGITHSMKLDRAQSFRRASFWALLERLDDSL